MKDIAQLEHAICQQLEEVIDPETGVDVMHLHLVDDLNISEDGCVTYTFRPFSYFGLMAVPLSMDIVRTVSEVKGVTRQKVKIEDYVEADLLNKLLNDDQDNSFGD